MNANTSQVPPYVLIEKSVGETPLECLEQWRAKHPDYTDLPIAYAGRLDPMASGTLLLLLGEECKNQEQYHSFDKEYEFSVLYGISSDSGDVLGIAKESPTVTIATAKISPVLTELTGTLTLPYPIFSSRTVQGKPLHTWAMEGRLAEITIPEKTSTVYSLILEKTRTISRADLVKEVLAKIGLLAKVTDPRKALGNDFRRPDVLRSWEEINQSGSATDTFLIASLTCSASSGTYMRSLAEKIGNMMGTTGLAFSIHRTKIGKYNSTTAVWDQVF